jgi:tripartite-type tricarboxylate transporter receptor subunit TctC
MHRLALIAGLLALVLPHTAALAQNYPTKPIRVIVPVGPGGGLDFVARLMAPALTESLGHTVVIDNRSGASGNIGVELAAQAAPDGYTLIFLSVSSVVSAIATRTRFDLQRDFAPVSLTTALNLVLVVHPAVPAKSVAELVAHAKANPGKVNFGSTGNATILHLAGELLGQATGISLVHVPYKSVAAATMDLMAGQVQMNFMGLTEAQPQSRTGKLRMLAVTSSGRAKAAPELPTMVEAGVPGFVLSAWHGMLAPAGTPQSVVDRLHAEIIKALRLPANAARLEEGNFETIASSPQQFAEQLKADFEKWAKVIKQAGLRMD